jgi:hypothetical protein
MIIAARGVYTNPIQNNLYDLYALPNEMADRKHNQGPATAPGQIETTGLLSKQELFEEIYTWSNLLTGETSFGNHEYIWPEPVKLLLKRLEHSSGGFFIGLIGLQGVGKSSAAMAIAHELQKVLDQRREKSAEAEGKDPDKIHGKWNVLYVKHLSSGSLVDSIGKATEEIWQETYVQTVDHELRGRMKSNKGLKQKVGDRLDSDGLEKLKDDDLDPEEIKSFLPARVLRDSKQEAIRSMLYDTHTLIIDLPDYSKTDKRLMVKDLNEVQGLWNELCHDSMRVEVPNFVVVLQKEMSSGHYLLGKMDIVEIRPFSPSELVDAYAKIWAEDLARVGIDLSTWPFDEDGLLFAARMARGIFRRFLKYIRTCLEARPLESSNDQIVDLDQAKAALDLDKIVRVDWDLELTEIFRKEEPKILADRIILGLFEAKEASQKNLAQALKVSEPTLSRILDKLEEYGFVVRERKGQEKTVRTNI